MEYEEGNKRLTLKNIPEKPLAEMIEKLQENRVIERIWEHDHTVWKDDPAEITDRLGWLDSQEKMRREVEQLQSFAGQIRSEGFSGVLLLGMGGSSLAAEVINKICGVREGYPEFAILDSTDPEAVLEKEYRFDPAKTLFIVATKSGGTVETISLMKYFYNRVAGVLGNEKAGSHFTAITDPGSNLEKTAHELSFKKVFLNDPAIGGRYSALSYFGLVPAALMGVDLHRLLETASLMAQSAKASDSSRDNENTPAVLGAALGSLYKNGHDKLTMFFSDPLKPLGSWIEQLIAESTGKEGKGILPVEGESIATPEVYGNDRFFVYFRLAGDSAGDAQVEQLVKAGHPLIQVNVHALSNFGGEFFRWMMATAIAGWALEINPFDQPNVEAAKTLAREMVEAYRQEGTLPEHKADLEAGMIKVYSGFQTDSLPQTWKTFLSQANPDKPGNRKKSYLAIQAFIKPDPETERALRELCNVLEARTKMAVTTGYGPRYLHSTGQLHKGDAGCGLFVQITSRSKQDLPVPDQAGSEYSSLTFDVLKNAQAMGDYRALKEKGRPVIRFHLEDDIADTIKKLTDAVPLNN